MRTAFCLVGILLLTAAPTAYAGPPIATGVEVDLRWMTNCPGPWGHEERTTVGPVTIRTYECDNGGT